MVRIDKTIEDVRRLAEGLVYGNPIVAEIKARRTTDPEAITMAVTAALQAEVDQNAGGLTLQAIVFDARKPSFMGA